MQKLASEFHRTTIITKQERTVLGSLKDVILNPETGDVVGLSFYISGNKNKELVVNTSDITGVGTNFIMIDSADNVSPPDEIIRIKEVLDKDIEIFGSYVVDEDGRHIGKVRDWSVNLKSMRLERLYVISSSLVKILVQDLIILANDIVKIEKGKIIIRSGSVKSGKKVTDVVKVGKPVSAEVAQMKSLPQNPKH